MSSSASPSSLNPPVAPAGPTFSVPAAILSAGGDSSGPWAQDEGSASAGGISNTSNTAIEPTVVAGSNAQYVAWSDNRSGTYEIYVVEHVNGAWQELAGSAHSGGISNSAGDSRRPAITLDSSGNPIVAWTTFNGASADIEAARYDPTANNNTGGWVAMGSSLLAGGISNDGASDSAKIAETSNGPVLTWLDSHTGITNVYAERFSGGTWSPLGAGAASGGGVTNSGVSIPAQALATDGANVALAWTQPAGANLYLFLLEYSGSSWSAVNASASGTGIDCSASGHFAQPAVAFSGGNLYVAWQQTSSAGQVIQAATSAGGPGWQMLAVDSTGSFAVSSATGNYAAESNPQLAAGGGTLELTWTQAALASAPAFTTAIDADQLNGSAFVRQLPGDAELNGINQTQSSISSIALAVDPSGHPFAAWGDSSSGASQIYFRGSASSVHNVYYVNDAQTATDLFTTGAGSAGNTGTSPASPLNSVQAVLSKYSLVAGDVILVDTGSYSGFTIPTADAGISIIGAGGAGAHFTTVATLATVSAVTLIGLNLDGGLSISGSTNSDVRNDSVAGITVTGGSGARVEQNLISAGGISLTGGTSSPYIEGNTIAATTGIAITGTGATGVDIIANAINATSGVVLSATSQSGIISGNNIRAASIGLQIASLFTGSIDHNEIQGATVGVSYGAAAPLNANRIFLNAIGVSDAINSLTTGLGFVGASVPNYIFQNTVGVQLTGLMQNQRIFSNTTGVTGSGTLGGNSLSQANVIETNQTGINFTGTIQFNDIDRNAVSIAVQNNQLIAHDLIYDNAGPNLETKGATGVKIINDTFYSPNQTNSQIDGGSSNVQVLNNILQTGGGYDLNIASNSRPDSSAITTISTPPAAD